MENTYKTKNGTYEILRDQPTEDKPFIVENYPYGYLKTQIKFWVESVKNKGDRFISQTLNPKTNKWNTPHKSTYTEVILLGIEEKTGHLKRVLDLSHWDEKEEHEKKLNFIRENKINLNELQETEIKKLNVMNKIREHLEVSFESVKYRHKETGEITEQVPIFEMSNYEEVGKEEREQRKKEQNHNLAVLNYKYSKEEGLIN